MLTKSYIDKHFSKIIFTVCLLTTPQNRLDASPPYLSSILYAPYFNTFVHLFKLFLYIFMAIYTSIANHKPIQKITAINADSLPFLQSSYGYQFHFDHLVYVDAYIAPKHLFVFPLSLQRIGQYNLFVLTANLHMQTDRFMI